MPEDSKFEKKKVDGDQKQRSNQKMLEQADAADEAETELTFKQKSRKCMKTTKGMIFSLESLLIAIVVLWLCVGTLVYSYVLEWPVGRAFYYTVQAGLSVGFGASDASLPIGVPDDPNIPCGMSSCKTALHLYTILHVMLGSSFIAAGLALFTQSAIEASNSTSYFDSPKKETKLEKLKKYLEKGKFVIILVVLILGMSVFIHLQATSPRLTFTEAMLYAVSGLSTGGLVAPDGNDPSQMWFTGITVLIGVAIYGLTLGSVSDLILARLMKRKLKEKLNKPINIKEFLHACKLEEDDEADITISWLEFLQMSLMRMDQVSTKDIKNIRALFHKMDIDGDQEFSITELIVNFIFDSFDVDKSGSIDADEFVLIIKRLQKTDTNSTKAQRDISKILQCLDTTEKIDNEFAEIDHDHTGDISRAELLGWWKATLVIDDEQPEAGATLKRRSLSVSKSKAKRHSTFSTMSRRNKRRPSGDVESRSSLDQLKAATAGPPSDSAPDATD